MACGRKFGKILKNVKQEYPRYSSSRQMSIAWAILKKQERRKKRKR